ncbi:MAG: hypothetical protein JXR88_08240 [Clostridia bacterium]|nr:hypothetical protein [Clostridia bacterium]
MKRYVKTIGISGAIYTNEFEKIKNYANKVREVREDTVIKSFKQGDVEVLVIFEETGQEILIDDFSDPELIKKYLGKKFL